MAKKSVATFTSDKSEKRPVVKCIRMVKSERTGAYMFQEEFVATEKVKDYFQNK